MKDKIEVGKLLDEIDHRRDAIHIAVIPVTAGCNMSRGAKVTYDKSTGRVWPYESCKAIGIIDPFLTAMFSRGQGVFVSFPDTITSLRHVWTHPEI